MIARGETQCSPFMGSSFRLTARYLSHPTDRTTVTPAVEHWLEQEKDRWIETKTEMQRKIVADKQKNGKKTEMGSYRDNDNGMGGD